MTGSRLIGALQLPDGSWIRGRGLRHPPPGGPAPDFGLYLGSRRLRRRHDGELPWPHSWIEWPDFLLPHDTPEAVRKIHDLRDRARAGARVEIACGGGVGRTGTVIACLVVLTGPAPAGAIAWTRANYHSRAVETPWQRGWVSRFPRHRPWTGDPCGVRPGEGLAVPYEGDDCPRPADRSRRGSSGTA